MDLRVVDKNQPPAKVPEENKHKKEVGNRRPLQEISNLVDDHHAPIIKKLSDLSLVNDQGEGDKTKSKNQDEPKKKVTCKPEPETVIIISSDDKEETEEKERKEHNQKKKNLRGNISNRKNKKIRSLTSVLTARSKLACGLTTKPRDKIINIDARDADNELAVVEYIEEIYNFYKLSEEENPLFDYMSNQSHISKTMRMILIDWLVEVHNKCELLPETLYLTINLVDRFLSKKAVSRKEIQLVGISSILLASKYEEIWAPEVNDFICISASAYTKEQILGMEKTILDELEWNLTVATPYVFLIRFIKAADSSDKKVENLAFYLVENSLIHYQTVKSFCPSMVSASAVYLAMHTLEKTPVWTETLKFYTGYCEDQLEECAKMLVRFQLAAKECKHKAVYRKFSSKDRDAVALFPPATKLLDSSRYDD